MRIYKCFDCFSCNEPFDTMQGSRMTPLIRLKGYDMLIGCAGSNGSRQGPAYWLLDLLSQPVFEKTGDGYQLQAIPELPRCPGCKKLFMNISPRLPHFLICGHLICDGCKANNRENKCYQCAAFYGNDANPECKILLDFFAQLLNEKPADLARKLMKEDRGADEQRKITLSECSDCHNSIPIASLIHCNDCLTVTCGGCFVKSHQGHEIVTLLQVELSSLQDRTSTHILGIFEGYDKNFQQLHASIRDGMATLTRAGAEKLKEIKEKAHYDEGRGLADEMTKLSADFEKQCEVYMPVARQFNDHLISYKERIEKKKE